MHSSTPVRPLRSNAAQRRQQQQEQPAEENPDSPARELEASGEGEDTVRRNSQQEDEFSSILDDRSGMADASYNALQGNGDGARQGEGGHQQQQVLPNDGLVVPVQNQQVQDMPEQRDIAAIRNCRLPQFWKENPTTWFDLVEATFVLHGISGDATKYGLVLSMLGPDGLQEIADILRHPPARDKYQTVKNALLSRLSLSADRQLHAMLTQLELGDKKPSRLLRDMRVLAGDNVSEDVLRVRWMDYLPGSTQRLLRVFKPTTALDELAAAADELVDPSPNVMDVGPGDNDAPHSCAVGGGGPPSRRPIQNSTAQELAAMRASIGQVTSTLRDLPEQIAARLRDHSRTTTAPMSTSRSRSRSRSTARSTARNGLCYFHFKFGAAARRCERPCSYNAAPTAGN